MVTKQDCMTHTMFYHVSVRNSDGTAARCRANGRCKEWKREPERFRLPVCHGLKGYFYIENHNADQWLTYDPTEEERRKQREEKEAIRKAKDDARKQKEKAKMAKKLGLSADVPNPVLHDAMLDAGLNVETVGWTW